MSLFFAPALALTLLQSAPAPSAPPASTPSASPTAPAVTPAAHAAHRAPRPVHPHRRPFTEGRDAAADIGRALTRAKADGKRVLVLFGANWCSDSRSFAGRLATKPFKAWVKPRYDIVYVDVGKKDRNLDLVKRYGGVDLKGIPLPVVLDGDGQRRNAGDKFDWGNAGNYREHEMLGAILAWDQ